MKLRLLLSAFIIAARLGFGFVYAATQGPIEGHVAIAQLNGGDAEYAAARAVSQGLAVRVANGVTIGTLVVLWLSLLLTKRKETAGVGVLLFIASTQIGCVGPLQVEKIEEIGPSETAFLVQLEGDTNSQDIFKSVEFLEKNKVGTKRVSIPTRKHVLGRTPGNFEWIPSATLIKVDRKPITREWTKATGTGTSAADQAVHVESKDSIGFAIGVNITTSIPEDSAATFLYHYAGKSLAEVTDQNIRGFVQAQLSREFGTRDLAEGRAAKKEIMDITFPATQTYFKERGISVDYVGFSEGLTYDDKEIQAAINRNFTAEMDVTAAKQEALAQEERNKKIVSQAEADRIASQEFAKAQEAAIAKVRLEIEKTRAEAQKIAAEKWNGAMPANILPEGSNILFGMGAPSNAK